MAMRSVVVRRAGLNRLMDTTRGAVRRFSDEQDGIFSDKRRAEEKIYIEKMERERMEKLKKKAEKEKAGKEKEAAEKKPGVQSS